MRPPQPAKRSIEVGCFEDMWTYEHRFWILPGLFDDFYTPLSDRVTALWLSRPTERSRPPNNELRAVPGEVGGVGAEGGCGSELEAFAVEIG